MLLEFKWYDLIKFSFISSIVFFLICLQTLTFQDVFSTNNNKSFDFTNESNLTTNTSKKNFINISDDVDNNTSLNQNRCCR